MLGSMSEYPSTYLHIASSLELEERDIENNSLQSYANKWPSVQKF